MNSSKPFLGKPIPHNFLFFCLRCQKTSHLIIFLIWAETPNEKHIFENAGPFLKYGKGDFVWMNFMMCAEKFWFLYFYIAWLSHLKHFARLSDSGAEKSMTINYMHLISLFKESGILRLNRIWAQKVHFIRDWPVLINGIFYGSIFSVMSHILPYCVYNPQIEQFEPSPNIRCPLLSLCFNRTGLCWKIFFLKFNPPFPRRTCSLQMEWWNERAWGGNIKMKFKEIQ